MQIQKCKGYQNQNFGTAIPIRTNNEATAIRLMSLSSLLQQEVKPPFIYLHLACKTGQEDLHKGIIGTKEHEELIKGFKVLSLWNPLREKMARFIERTVDEEGSKPVVIDRIEQILDLPMFANCRDTIAKAIACITND